MKTKAVMVKYISLTLPWAIRIYIEKKLALFIILYIRLSKIRLNSKYKATADPNTANSVEIKLRAIVLTMDNRIIEG